MNLPVLITCERGLGKLTEYACGRRWLVAHDRKTLDGRTGNQDTAAIRQSPCRTCPHGEARVKDAAPSSTRACYACNKPLPAAAHRTSRYHAECRPSTYKPKTARQPQAQPAPEPEPIEQPAEIVEEPVSAAPPEPVRRHGGGRPRTGQILLRRSGYYGRWIVEGVGNARVRECHPLGTLNEDEARARLAQLMAGELPADAWAHAARDISEAQLQTAGGIVQHIEGRELHSIALELTDEELARIEQAFGADDEPLRKSKNLAGWARRGLLEFAGVVLHGR